MESDLLHSFSFYNEIVAPYLNTLDEIDKIYYTLRSIAKADQTAEMVEYAIRNYSANSRRPILGVLSKKTTDKRIMPSSFSKRQKKFLACSKEIH